MIDNCIVVFVCNKNKEISETSQRKNFSFTTL